MTNKCIMVGLIIFWIGSYWLLSKVTVYPLATLLIAAVALAVLLFAAIFLLDAIGYIPDEMNDS